MPAAPTTPEPVAVVTTFHGRAFVTVREGAELLGVSESTFDLWVKTGKLPPPCGAGRVRRWHVQRLIDAMARMR